MTPCWHTRIPTDLKQQQVLFDNTARSISGAPKEIQLRHIGNCLKADPAYGKGVAEALGIPLSELPLPLASQLG